MSIRTSTPDISKHILAAAMLLLAFSSVFSQEPPGFKVAGRDLYDRCGEKVILRGVNKMTVWTDIDGAAFPEIEKTGANTTRIVWTSTGDLGKLDAAIAKCYANKMIPMVENHDATGEWSKLPEIVNWWIKPEVVSIIQKHEEYLLVNIANECGQTVSDADFRAGYTDAITKMRAAGIRTPLVIDAAKYGQDIDILQSVGPDLINADPDKNILLSAHGWWPDVYGFNDNFIINELAESVQKNLPLIIGEFAHTAVGCNGIINYKLIMSEAEKHGIGWMAWSWGPGNSDCAEMDMTTDNTFGTLQGWALEVATTDPNSIANTSVRPKSIVDGVCEGSNTTRFTVSAIATGRGRVAISPNRTMVDSGEVVTITATADNNNEFLNWSGDASGTENPLTITVDKATNITAVFSDNGPAVGVELVANGDFTSGDDGWTFGTWEGAVGTSEVVNGEYVVTMTTAGAEGWHGQLTKTGIDIAQGTSYVVSLKARADAPYELQAVVGQQVDPWTAYSGYERFQIDTEMKAYSYTFTMSEASDQDARIVFDVGDYSGKLYLDDVSVKAIETSNVIGQKNQKLFSASYEGNGVFLFNVPEALYGSLELYNIAGKRLERRAPSFYLAGLNNVLFHGQLEAGTYILHIESPTTSFSQKVDVTN